MKSDSKVEQEYISCVEQIEKSTCVDSQLTHAIEFMRKALSTEVKARFKDFWKMKKICLELFKKDIHKTKRNAYWQEYTTLLSEAHALQKILEEQFHFQAEQISLAINGLVKEWERKDSKAFEKAPELFKNFEDGQALFEKQELLNVYHKLREQALAYRSEILALEIRISQKNKLLAELSKISDKIFPERKTLFKSLSNQFSELTKKFIHANFDLKEKSFISTQPIYEVRAKIKSFQVALKELSITNDSYGKIRKEFTLCWDILKLSEDKEKVLLKERKEKAPAEIESELQELAKIQDEEKLNKFSKKVIEQLFNNEVSNEAIALMKRAISSKRGRLEAEIEKEKKERVLEKAKKKKKLQEEYALTIQSMVDLTENANNMKLKAAQEKFDESLDLLSKYTLSEKEELTFSYHKQRVSLELLNIRGDQGEEVHEQYQELYKQIKNALEEMKRLKNSCGMDIELAFQLDEYISESKHSLTRIEEEFEKVLVSV